MASRPNDQQAPDVKQTELQVQQDQERLMAQMNQQEQATASGNLQATVAATTASGQVQLHSPGRAAWQMTLGLVNAFFIDPTKEMGAALNPLKGLQYATYHPGFIPNIGGALFHHDADAINQVQNSLAMLPDRLTSLGALGAGIWGTEHLHLGGIAGKGLSAVLRGFGMGDRLAGLAGGVASFGLYTLALDAANYMAQGTIDIGGFTQMANTLGNKYIGRLASTNVNGIGFKPTEATEFGINLYRMSRESGYGLRGLSGERFSEGDVEKVAMMADQAGLLKDATDIGEMTDKISNLLRAYKSVAKELHLTAQGGLSLSAGLMNLGFNTAESIMGVTKEVANVAESTGQSYKEALYSGTSMAEKFLTGGLGQTGGMTYGLQSNLFQSYLYQTHKAQYMPEGLGGYNAALMINQAGQMGMVGNPLFQNALTIASYGGGYNRDLMNKAIEMNPLVTSIYAKALLGNNPNKIYANVWNAGDNATQALSDPTMQARMIAGDLRRARIDMNNDAAVKGYLYNYYRRSGISAGQARYAADNMYAQIKNIGNMDIIDSGNLLREENINVPLLNTLLQQSNIDTFQYYTGGALHRVSTGIGQAINRGGAHIAENIGETLRGWRHEVNYTPVKHGAEYYNIQRMGMQLSGLDMNATYLTPANSGALGFVKAYRMVQRNPGQPFSREQYLSAGRKILEDPTLNKLYEHIQQNLYDPYYHAASARTQADAWGAVAELGGLAVAGIASIATFNPAPVFAATFAMGGQGKDIGQIYDPIYKITHGFTGEAINPDVIPVINTLINKLAEEKVEPGSASWGNYLHIIAPNMTEKDIERTRRIAGGKVKSDYEKEIKMLKKRRHEYARSTQRTIEAFVFDRITDGTLGSAHEATRKYIHKLGDAHALSKAFGYAELINEAHEKGRPELVREYRTKLLDFLGEKGLKRDEALNVASYLQHEPLSNISHKAERMMGRHAIEKNPHTFNEESVWDAVERHKDAYANLSWNIAVTDEAIAGAQYQLGVEKASEDITAGTPLGTARQLINKYDLSHFMKNAKSRGIITAAIKASGDRALLNEWNSALTGDESAFIKLKHDMSIAGTGGRAEPTYTQLRSESDLFSTMGTLTTKMETLITMVDRIIVNNPQLVQ